MTRRNTTDPLVAESVRVYGINFLRAPRENADVGDTYVDAGAGILPPGKIESLCEDFALPNVSRGERFEPAERRLSRALELEAGFSMLTRMLAILGLEVGASEAQASLARQGARSVRIKLGDATRDSVDIIAFASKLNQALVREESRPLIETSHRIYCTTGVARCRNLLIVAEDKDGEKVDVTTSFAGKASAQASLSRTADGDLAINYKGKKSLAFGVELVELEIIEGRMPVALAVKGPAPPVDIRVGKKDLGEEGITKLYRIFLGDRRAGEIFVDLPEVDLRARSSE